MSNFTPAIISQVYSHYIFAYRIATCFALSQYFLKSISTTFFAYRIAACFALPQYFLKSITTTFLLIGLLRASHSRNNFSSLFPLHFCLPDCCVLRTPAILPKHSHIVKLSLHFMLILGACPKSSHPPLCKHRWMAGLVHCKRKKEKPPLYVFSHKVMASNIQF